MKILTIIGDLDKGGTQRAAQTFAEAYKKIGHDSRILSLYGLGPRYDEINVWYKISDKNLAEMKIWSPDIIHIHSHGPKEKDINKIIDELKNNSTKIIEQSVFSIPSPWEKRLDLSFQLSNWALWLYNMRGGDKSKSVIIPYPINCNAFCRKEAVEINSFKREYGIPQNAFVIGRIGQAFYGKWSTVLIDSFNKLAKKHLDLYMVVVNPPNNILKEINKSIYKNRIIHIPKIYGDDALSITYSAFDLMIHVAEQGESFGYVLAEALLCKTPVITLSTPWGDNSQCEVVGNRKGGYVVNKSNHITDAVEDYIINIKSQNKLKDGGRDHIYNNYDYIKVANQAINFTLSKKIISEPSLITDDVNLILKNTFDKNDLITYLLINSNILSFRILTLYKYPPKIIIQKLVRKIKSIFKYEQK